MTSSPGDRSKAEDILIRRADILSDDAQHLIAALNRELTKRYPEDGANHFRLDPDEVADGRGVFLIAFVNGRPMGCGAVRKLDDEVAEIKRMYVTLESRGLGLGRKILGALESEARALEVNRLVLEAGERQVEAVALYERSGFHAIPPFGDYLNSPLSLCMGKDLLSKENT